MKVRLPTVFILIISLALMSSASGTLAQGSGSGQVGNAVAAQQQARNVELVGQIGIADSLYGVAVRGDYVYIVGDNGLYIVNVSNPAAPIQTGFCNAPGPAIAGAGDYAYVASGDAGLRIVDVSDPAAPSQVGLYVTGDYAFSVAVASSYAYVGTGDFVTGDTYLRIVDVSHPTAPTAIGFCDLYGWPYDIAVAGNYAYIASGGGRLRIIDVSNPAAPTEVGSAYTPGWAFGVAVAGGYAYVAAQASGLRILNVSDPASPTKVGSYDTWNAHDVAVAGNYAYVADSDAGLRILDISSPAAPSEVGFYDTPGQAWYVVVDGNYVFVNDRSSGLVILWFAPPASASVSTGGGSLTSSVDNTTYTFPAGAFTETVVITHTPRFPGNTPSPGNLVGIGHTFEVTAVYSSTGQPAQLAPGATYTVTVHYTDAEKGPAIEDALGLYWWDEGASQWSQQGTTSTVNTTDNLITVRLDHLSLFAVLGETRRVFLPLVLRNYP